MECHKTQQKKCIGQLNYIYICNRYSHVYSQRHIQMTECTQSLGIAFSRNRLLKIEHVEIHASTYPDVIGFLCASLIQTWVLVFMNNAPIHQYRESQLTVESSTFVEEFFAIIIVMQMVEALHHKIIMFGLPIDVYDNIFFDSNKK